MRVASEKNHDELVSKQIVSRDVEVNIERLKSNFEDRFAELERSINLKTQEVRRDFLWGQLTIQKSTPNTKNKRSKLFNRCHLTTTTRLMSGITITDQAAKSTN